MKIIYMGTPQFAVAPLNALCASEHSVVAVVTQPDSRSGRGKSITPCPLKIAAQELNISVYQPERVSSLESVEYLRALNADVIVVCAYGQLLSEALLSLCPYGAINIHASVLPNYRGAAPINRAIMDGASYSGISIMYMAKGLDSGDIFSSEYVEIADKTFGELEAELSELGAKMIVAAIADLSRGNSPRTPQGEKFTYAEKLSKSEARISFDKDSRMVYNHIRSLNPEPGAYAVASDGKSLKIYDVVLNPIDSEAEAGSILGIHNGALCVACEVGTIGILTLKPEGKKLMTASAFLSGRRDKQELRFV